MYYGHGKYQGILVKLNVIVRIMGRGRGRDRGRGLRQQGQEQGQSQGQRRIQVRVELTRGLGSGSAFGLECMASGLDLILIRSTDPGRRTSQIKVKYSSSRSVTVKYQV